MAALASRNMAIFVFIEKRAVGFLHFGKVGFESLDGFVFEKGFGCKRDKLPRFDGTGFFDSALKLGDCVSGFRQFGF